MPKIDKTYRIEVQRVQPDMTKAELKGDSNYVLAVGYGQDYERAILAMAKQLCASHEERADE